jgi:C4-dicarboxylate-specific signal transduction histidine kinase
MARILDNFDLLDLLAKEACAVFAMGSYELLTGNECFRSWTNPGPEVNVFELCPDLSEERFKRGIETRGRFSLRTVVNAPRRGAIDVNFSFNRIEHDGETFVFLHGTDRSREKEKDAILERAIRLLEKRNTELDQLNKALAEAHNQLILTGKLTALGEMASSMILEMRHPLQLIMVNAALLDEHMRDEQSTEMLQSIVQSSARVSRIVESLQNFSRSEARDPMRPRRVSDIIDDTLVLCRQQIENRGVLLQYDDCDRDMVVACHPVEVSQVLLNLISNAADAVVGLDDPWVRIEAEQVGKEVHISVVDSGGGIPSSLADKLMEPFFTMKDLGAGSGTGLGLTISKRIIEAHGGQLFLDTECDDTRFVARLPLSDLEPEEVLRSA